MNIGIEDHVAGIKLQFEVVRQFSPGREEDLHNFFIIKGIIPMCVRVPNGGVRG